MQLKIKDLEFKYPSVPVLKNICMELSSGEILAIVGKNGAGKSTLLKCINRILESQNGSILIDEKEATKMKRKDIAKKIAYLPQRTSHTFPITVFDIVLMGRYPHLNWHSNENDEKQVSEVLEMLKLESLALRDFNEISGGQQQKVLIARALAQEANILLLDEPTSDLDIRHQLEVMEITQKLVWEKNISAIVAIHDLNLASRYAERVIMLSRGIIFAAGSPSSVFTPENIAKVYGVEASVTEKEGDLHIIPIRPISR
jgi:iron complex transport system ATP-binding protein